MRGRGDRQEVDDHRFIPSDEWMVDVEAMIGRPVPVKKIAVGLLSVPIPLDLAPHPGDAVAYLALLRSVAIEILASGEQAMNHEGGFDEIATVVIFPEVWKDFPGASVEEVRPDAVEAIGVLQEACDLQHEVDTIIDVEDAMPGGAYTLEVSSPGLDRKLTKAAEFERFQGSLVKLTTHEPLDGNRHFEGRLEKFENGRLTLDQSATKRKPKKGQALPPERVEIDLGNIEKANLVPEI